MTYRNYSAEIAEKIRDFLQEDDWKFSFDEVKGVFKFGLRIHSKLRKLSYIVDVKEDEYIVYGMLPIAADEDDPEMMAQVSEYVNRANYGLKNGCFELDFDDGEIRFKIYVDCDDQLPGRQVIRNSIYCTAAMVDRYADGFGDIIFCGLSAKAAVEKREGPLREAIEAIESMSEDPFDEEEGDE